jgi:cytochrome c oxidase subunit II
MSWVPELASSFAYKVDGVLWFVTVLSVIFFVLITIILIYFSVKYRRKSEKDVTPHITGNEKLEIIWTVIPSILLLIIFVYATVVYKEMRTPPADAMEINVTAKQWLWVFNYENGNSTINELYVPHNRPVRMVMRADDVLHSFFVPAFRVKQDIVPGMYTQLWFKPIKVGTYNLFCAEYCGTGHSQMLAKVFVMSPEAYSRWETGDESDGLTAVASSKSPEELGKELYTNKGCNACHSVDGNAGVGPTFKGLFGRKENMQDGSNIVVDENYLIESIYEPQAKIVQGFAPVMPSFKGILKEEEVDGIIAYIKTIK